MAELILSQKISDGNDKSKQGALSLWNLWWNAIQLLRPAFSHAPTFLWFAVAVAGLTVRTDMLGVTSIVRALNLRSRFYDALIRNFHSNAVRLDELSAVWTRTVLHLFSTPVRVNGRLVLVGDGLKTAKCGKKMPGVKLLHQQSENKPEFIMGHHMQSVSLLVHADQSVAAVPLSTRIHEGAVFSNRDRRTLLDKMLSLLGIVGTAIAEKCYFIGDAYYGAGKMADGILRQGHHLLTRMKSNAVAYELPVKHKTRKRGRPAIYGNKIQLASLLQNRKGMQQSASPVRGERNVILQYRACDLLWRPAGILVRYVAVVHPTKGSWLLMCTDTTLDAFEIIRLYAWRFKIEHSFKQAVHRIGTFAYHFWMKAMKTRKRRNGNQYLHRESLEYRNAVKRKIHAYHVFIQVGVVSQGLLQYLAVRFPQLVWRSCRTWIRTIRPGIAPSEFVVSNTLRSCLPDFLSSSKNDAAFAKFIMERQNLDEMEMFCMSA